MIDWVASDLRLNSFYKTIMENILKRICPSIRSVGVCVSLLLATSAEAYKGVELGRDCRSTEDAARARCEGFINGFLAGAQVDVEGEPITMWRYLGYTWCGPAVVAIPEIVKALFEAASTGRATPHFPAPLMLAQSLYVKFPCEGLTRPRLPKIKFFAGTR